MLRIFCVRLRRTHTGLGLLRLPLLWLALASAAVVACGRDTSTTPHPGPPGSREFDLARIGENALPALDSGDSVDLHGLVEYREIYLERGTLTLAQESTRFETVLHYAWYAVTIDDSGQRHLELRAALDIRDHGSVESDSQGNLRLRSDVSGVEHTATPVNGGYTVLYRQVAMTQPLTLLFEQRVN